MSPSVHVYNKGKDILIFVEEPTQGLNDATLTAEANISSILHNLEKALF